MKFLAVILFCLTSICVDFLGLSHIAIADELTTINIEVKHNKANGKSWDSLQGKPDLAICLSNSLTGTLCLPEGDRLDSIFSSQCPDSYRCKFSVLIPDKTFKFSVVDVDSVLNDPIGIGHCSIGKTCDIGQATVSIGKINR